MSVNKPAGAEATEPKQLEDAPTGEHVEVVHEPAVVLLELMLLVLVCGRRLHHREGPPNGRNAGAMLGADPDKLLTAA
jgi:hypothetical protein